MKKSIVLWMSGLILTMAGLNGCSSDDESQFHIKNVANSGCKSMAATRGETRDDVPYSLRQEYIEYKGLANGYLSLNHVNACFNCEPGELKMQATISGNEITIVETEQFQGANCICPYDLYCEVGPLEDGEYTITFWEGSELHQATTPLKRAQFTVSYKNGLNGKHTIGL